MEEEGKTVAMVVCSSLSRPMHRASYNGDYEIEMARLVETAMMPNTDEFYRWQRPRELWGSAKQAGATVSDEDLMNRAGEFIHKLKEVLVASTFAVGFSGLVTLVKIRMADGELLDFELLEDDGTIHEFEIVTAYERGRAPGLDYREGKRPSIPMRAFSGEPVPPEWIAPSILAKTDKARRLGVKRHLLVYQNIAGGGTDFDKLMQLIRGSESAWHSIWMIVGIPDLVGMVLLCNQYCFSCPEKQWINLHELMSVEGRQ